MSFRSSFLAPVAIIAMTLPAHAQQDTRSYERRLLPVHLELSPGIPGANGSLWRTFLVGRNESDTHVRVVQHPDATCSIGGCPPEDAAPRSTFTPQLSTSISHPGAFVHIESRGAETLYFNLRVQDLSRQSETWGTEIPVVRERDFHTSVFQLLNIPTSPEFRTNLRVYDFDGIDGLQVRVSILPVSGGGVLASEVLRLNAPVPVHRYPVNPAYVQVTSIRERYPQIVAAGRVRIQIEPLTAGSKIWAFASVTNNATQHVTVVAPQ